MSFCSQNITQGLPFFKLLPTSMSNAAFAEILTPVLTFPFFLPVSLLSLCHVSWGSGSYQQFSLLSCRDCKASGWRKLLLRDEEELRSSEPLVNVSWRGLFSAFYSLLNVLLVSLTALERKWQKSSFEFFEPQFDKQSGRAEGCIATDEKTSIWRHWNKVEQSQSPIIKDRDFRLLCSVVTWIMLKNIFFAIVAMELLGFDKYIFQLLVSSSSDRALFQ